MAARGSLRLRALRLLVTSETKSLGRPFRLTGDAIRGVLRCGLFGCSMTASTISASIARATTATPTAAGRLRASRAPPSRRNAATRRALAIAARATPRSRRRPSRGLAFGRFRGRRGPSRESLESLGAGWVSRSSTAATVTIDPCSPAAPGSRWQEVDSGAPGSRGRSSGPAGRYHPRFRLLSGRSALLDGRLEDRPDGPSASVGRPPCRRSRAPLRPSPVLLAFPSGDSI